MTGSGAFNAGRRKRTPTINITPLIDVMFLLLIFFMVSSTFKQDLGIDITLPQAESGSTQQVTSYQITVDREGQTYFAGEKVNEEALRRKLTEIVAADPDAPLVLRADDGADFGRVLRVIDIARGLNAGNLVIPTDPLRADRAGR